MGYIVYGKLVVYNKGYWVLGDKLLHLKIRREVFSKDISREEVLIFTDFEVAHLQAS